MEADDHLPSFSQDPNTLSKISLPPPFLSNMNSFSCVCFKISAPLRPFHTTFNLVFSFFHFGLFKRSPPSVPVFFSKQMFILNRVPSTPFSMLPLCCRFPYPYSSYRIWPPPQLLSFFAMLGAPPSHKFIASFYTFWYGQCFTRKA